MEDISCFNAKDFLFLCMGVVFASCQDANIV